MQLDRTRVVIRQRSLMEIADLALPVLHRYFWPLTVVWFLGVIPYCLINWLILAWIPIQGLTTELFHEEYVEAHTRYVWLMCLLVFLQAPLGCAGITVWLGRAVFQERPTLGEVWRDMRSSTWRAFLVLGCIRGAIPVTLMVATNWGQPVAPFREITFGILAMLIFGILRLARPFMPEILLLERCPLRGNAPDAITATRRSAILHTPLASDVVGRGTALMGVALFSTVSLLLGLAFLRAYLGNTTGWGADTALVLVPLTLWVIAGVMTVMRFLMYLDTRIRLEGWEVELNLRAEAERWIPKEVSTVTAGIAESVKAGR